MREARLWGIMYTQVRKPPESGVRMREDYVIRDLIDRAIWDEHFRYRARLYLEQSLREAGFWNDLTVQERQLIADFQSDSSGYTDVELVEELKRRSLSVEGPEWGP
jgi:hypothetical protein